MTGGHYALVNRPVNYSKQWVVKMLNNRAGIWAGSRVDNTRVYTQNKFLNGGSNPPLSTI